MSDVRVASDYPVSAAGNMGVQCGPPVGDELEASRPKYYPPRGLLPLHLTSFLSNTPMILHKPLRHLFRTSLPLLALGSLLPGCKDKGASSDPEGMGGDGPKGVACETDEDCDDSFYCNGEELCTDGVCSQGEPIDCDDGVDCTIDSCDEQSQSCRNRAPDADGDGHTAADCESDEVAPGDDCDDSDPLRYPGNLEICDPENRDEDCDPSTLGARDSDQDGFIDAACCNEQPDGELECEDDCDDYKPNVNPSATEACDFLDNNCDGETDEGVSIAMYRDADHDGRGDDELGTVQTCAGAVGYATIGGDCDDSDPEVFLGQFEICDDKDNNCNDAVDEVKELAPWYPDVDQDTYGDPERTPVFSCYRIPGRVMSQNDCDDTNNKINPNATEICDGLDNDCNGRADFKLTGVNNFEDDDADGVADADCGGPDCDDQDPRTAEGAEEVCDRVDNDCDGEVDEQTVQNIWYIDEDGDGWGVVIGSALASCDPIAGRASNFGDCDDTDRDRRPGVAEICDNIDNDCDGIIDEGAAVHCDLPNALSTCRFGACEVFTCVPGFSDANNNPADGCEATVNPAVYMTTDFCTTDIGCSDGDLCTGFETCHEGNCRLGNPINCAAGPSVIEGNVTLADGRDVKDMEGIDTITGDVFISGTQLSSLVGLESLRVIGGDLYIQGNSNLLRLSGSALSHLEIVGGGIYVESNPSLLDVDLPSLISANSINIVNNDELETIAGYEQLATVESLLFIANNSQLTTIEGFPSLVRVGGENDQSEGGCNGQGGLEVESHPVLTEISAFAALGIVEGDVCVRSNYQLGEVSFPALETIGLSFDVEYVNAATSIVMPALMSAGSIDIYAYAGGEGGVVALETVSMPALVEVEEGISFEGAANTLTEFLFPELETAGYLDVYIGSYYYEPALVFETLDFSSLTEADSINLSLFPTSSASQGMVLTLPELLNVNSDMNLDVYTNVGSVDMPLLQTIGGEGNFYIESSAITDISFPVLTQVGGNFDLTFGAGAAESIDFGELVTIGGEGRFNAQTEALDIGKLTGLDSQDFYTIDVEICVGPFDGCTESARLEGLGYCVYTCGYCTDVCGL